MLYLRSKINVLFHSLVPDPCLSNPCDPNAVCTREGPVSGAFNCTCTSPFEGNGFACAGRINYPTGFFRLPLKRHLLIILMTLVLVSSS